MGKKAIFFLDGKWMPATEKLLSDHLPWRLKGKGVFETVLVNDFKAVMLLDHLKRLDQGLKHLKIKSPYRDQELRKIIRKILLANPFKKARLRVVVWRDKKRTHCSIAVMPLQENKKAFRLTVASRKWPFSSKPAFLKSIDYKFFHAVFQQAKKKNADEAVVLNRKNEIVEGSRSNIFLVKDGRVMTPPLQSGCLNGVTRQKVLFLIKQSGLVCQSKNIRIADLKEADEIFLTNSLIGIKPVVSFMDKKKRSKVTARLMGRYRRLFKPNS